MAQKKTAMEYAILLLGLRAYSTAELKKKLYAKEYSTAEISQVIQECTRHGFLNDEHYAENLAAAVYARGGGKRKAIQKLRTKGIDSELIKETLAEKEDGNVMTELEAAAGALSRKASAFAREPDPRKRREKALRFLAGRGFSAQVAYEALRKLAM
ncbi:MAG TPA: hypothetical protein DE060_12245 [Lentisphaeria bacterium]|nr:hypothetical protein [Lentisphaeria bacterium]HCG49959.1 hypothetical protein [Lentisphaeria bacterium]